MRNIYFCLALLGLSACAGGPALNLEQTKAGIAEGKGRVVVYRPMTYAYIGRLPTVKFNGVDACNLPGGAYFSKDVAPGKIVISSGFWDIPENSSYAIDIEAGKVAYIEMAMKPASANTAMPGGLLGTLLILKFESADKNTVDNRNPQPDSNQKGPMVFTLVDPNTIEASKYSRMDCS